MCSRKLVFNKFLSTRSITTSQSSPIYATPDSYRALLDNFRADQYEQVLEGYLALRRRSIRLHSSAVTFSLKSCIGLGWLGFGRGVHGDALKFGFNADPFAGSALVGLYSKLGVIEDAAKVFDEMEDRDTVAYTSMISAFSQVGGGFASAAFRVFGDMRRELLEPNRVTLVSLLQAVAELGEVKAGRAIHGFALRRRIGCSDEVFETALMGMYIRCGSLTMASRISDPTKMTTPGSWNALTAGYLQIGQPMEAFNLFMRMVQQNVGLDIVSLANALSACANLVLLKEGKSIHGYIFRAGVKLDVVASTALIDLYCKCGKLEQARELYNRLEKKDVVTCNVMLAGYVQNGFAREAVEIYLNMIRAGHKPNLASLLTILSAISYLKDVRTCLALHGYLIKLGLESNTEIANQLINTYVKCGILHVARQVFNWMRCHDLVSWTSIMVGYILNGHADEAIVLFRNMQQERFGHDCVTLTTLLQAFSRLGFLKSVREVHCIMYRSLKKIDLTLVNSLITTYAKCGRLDLASFLFQCTASRCLTSWNAMIAAYSMHGSPEEALKLYNQMKIEGLKPDGATFTSLLTACSHSGSVEVGICIFKSMCEEHSFIPRDEHYSCLVDLLSRAGRLAEAYELFKRLPLDEISSAQGSLLAACRVYGDQKMGEAIGRELLDFGCEKPSVYASISNFYAEGQRWEEVARVRSIIKERCVKSTPGYSFFFCSEKVISLIIYRITSPLHDLNIEYGITSWMIQTKFLDPSQGHERVN